MTHPRSGGPAEGCFSRQPRPGCFGNRAALASCFFFWLPNLVGLGAFVLFFDFKFRGCPGIGGPRSVVAEHTDGRSRSGLAVNGRDKARPSKMEGYALSWLLALLSLEVSIQKDAFSSRKTCKFLEKSG